MNHVLCDAGDDFRANHGSGLVVALNIGGGAFGVLSAAIAAYGFIMSWASVAGCHDDLAATQLGEKLFQLSDKVHADLRGMSLSAFAAKFNGVSGNSRCAVHRSFL